MYNLHNHTTCSDGKLTPEELIKMAYEKGLSGIAITDHDNIDAASIAKEFLKNKNWDFTFISGVEISCKLSDDDFIKRVKEKTGKPFPEIHVLGLGVDENNPLLKEELENLLIQRKNRGLLMIEKLRDAGYEIFRDFNIEDEPFIGRVKIAHELVRIGEAETVSEAFEKFLNRTSPYYVKSKVLTVKRAIEIIHFAGGIASLAHPGEIGNEEVLKRVLKENFDALECYHPSNDKAMTKRLLMETERLGIKVTGGSDFHGIEEQAYEDFTKYGVNELWL